MTKTLTLLAIIFLPNLSFGQNQDLIGIWEGEDQREIGRLEFDQEGFAYLTIGGETFGGPSYFIYEKEVALRYAMDQAVSPHWIDFVIEVKADSSEFDRMLGIIEFSKDLTQMKICLNFGEGKRPEAFLEDYTIELYKKE